MQKQTHGNESESDPELADDVRTPKSDERSERISGLFDTIRGGKATPKSFKKEVKRPSQPKTSISRDEKRRLRRKVRAEQSFENCGACGGLGTIVRRTKRSSEYYCENEKCGAMYYRPTPKMRKKRC